MRLKDSKNDVDIIVALEGDTLIVEDLEDWNKLKELAYDFSRSQGFYGRLYMDMIEAEESGEISFPIYF